MLLAEAQNRRLHSTFGCVSLTCTLVIRAKFTFILDPSFQLPYNLARFLGFLVQGLSFVCSVCSLLPCVKQHSFCSRNTPNRGSYVAHQKACRQEEAETGEEAAAAAAAAGEEMSC